MKTTHLITAIALLAAGSARAAEAPNYGAVEAQSTVQRAEAIADTKRAMASGELKFGALADYQAQFTPSPARRNRASGALSHDAPMATERAKPPLSAQK
jgi:hypothetical protein